MTVSYADIAEELHQRTSRIVWASAATIDRRDRTRIRILHPVWEGQICWIGTNPRGLLSKHLAERPYMSLSYVNGFLEGEGTEQVYVDCTTEWVEDPAEKRRVWEYTKSLPKPVGHDPAVSFDSFDSPKYGLLRLTPWRIEIGSLTPSDGWKQQIWHADEP